MTEPAPAWPSPGTADPPLAAVRRVVAEALAEDVLPLGDITAALVPDSPAGARVVARAPGVVAGRLCAMEAFAQVDPAVTVKWRLPDGSAVECGATVGVVRGSLRSILTAERTALNFLCHLSGVATSARRFVDAVAAVNPRTRVLDTRKTTPGLRAVEKAAVRAGGAWNHRGNLSEMVLVKDNHLGGATIGDAVARALRWWPGRAVEVECDRLDQVVDALDAGATAVLLDNMSPDEVSSCMSVVRAHRRADAVLVEVSGGISLESAPRYAAAGVDLVSVGAITHSAAALDLGLDLDPGGR